jgi:soluble lytic murein transglycosylase
MLSIRTFSRVWLLPCILALWTSPGSAKITDSLATQRSLFLEAEKALEAGKMGRFRELRDSLQGYPLYPYLRYRELVNKLSRASKEEVSGFLQEHADTPLAERLRRKWLAELARQGRWSEYLRVYRPTRDAEEQCTQLRALIATGQAKSAYEHVPRLWLVGHSQPEACDPVFDAWRREGHLTSDLVWERIRLAMDRGQARLARYLGRFLDSRDRVWLNRWLQVHRHPEQVGSHARFSSAHPRREDILLHGVNRLVSSNPAQAADLWNDLQSRYPFTPSQHARIEGKLAIALMRNGNPEALEQFLRIEPCTTDRRLQEIRIITALLDEEWEQALTWMDVLPETERESERWRYWRARALDRLGFRDEAKTLFKAVSEERSYYGFLAADHISSKYRFAHARLEVSDSELAALRKHSGIRRARELMLLDRTVDARREWHFAKAGLTAAELKAAARLAKDWGWHDLAIFTLAKADYWDDLELRFPLLHKQQVERMAARRNLDTAWVFAVMRQESAFNPEARSPAGARGLMQLMPRTARHVAKKIKARAPRSSDLYKPELNILLGTSYLREMLDELDQNMVLAIAAYNAGPHRVRGWLPDKPIPADLWVETVPFNETRTYLRRVLYYTAIYEHRLGQTPVRLVERMPEVTDFTVRSAGTGAPQKIASSR